MDHMSFETLSNVHLIFHTTFHHIYSIKKKPIQSKPAQSKPKPAQSKRKRAEEDEEEEDEIDDEDNEKSGSDNGSDDNDSDDGNGSDEDEDVKKAPAGKKQKKNAKDDKKKKQQQQSKGSSKKTVTKLAESSSSTLPKAKKLRKVERLEEARKSFKWWEADDLPDGINWRKLEHAGIAFAPPYVPHGIPIKYDGNILHLTEKQEEMASFYAALPDDGPQLGIPKTRVVFQKNFFVDFKATFPAGSVVKKFVKCDFSDIKEHLSLQKSLSKAATDEEKAVKKALKEDIVLQFGYCLIDGRMERVSLII